MTIELLIYLGVTIFVFGRGWQRIHGRLDRIDERLDSNHNSQKLLAHKVGEIRGWAHKHELKYGGSKDAGLAE